MENGAVLSRGVRSDPASASLSEEVGTKSSSRVA